MILTNASTVYRLQREGKISLSDIRKYAHDNNVNGNLLFPMLDYPFWEEVIYRYVKHFPKYGSPFSPPPFLSNSVVSFNIYEFIQNWSLFNIGEIISVEDHPLDEDLKKFSRSLLSKTRLSQIISIEGNDQFEFEGDLFVLATHLNLDEV